MSQPEPAITVDERTRVAEAMLAICFMLRPSNDQRGQAWTLQVMTTGLVRAILASVGPTGDATEILEVVRRETEKGVQNAQSQFIRDRLTAPAGKGRAS